LDLELFASTHPDEQAKWERAGGGRVNDRKGAKGLVGVWRDWGEREEFGPVLIELTVEEMERREQERAREAR
jgi:chromatin structure-remodeling complex subunit SFH1